MNHLKVQSLVVPSLSEIEEFFNKAAMAAASYYRDDLLLWWPPMESLIIGSSSPNQSARRLVQTKPLLVRASLNQNVAAARREEDSDRQRQSQCFFCDFSENVKESAAKDENSKVNVNRASEVIALRRSKRIKRTPRWMADYAVTYTGMKHVTSSFDYH